jgi:uroporphyrinogen decarboxylase
MNGLERISAVVAGKATDRRPFTVLCSLYGSRLTGTSLEEHFSNPKLYVDGQSAVLETFTPDILFSPFFMAAFGKAFGSELKPLKNQAPNLKRPAAITPKEVSRLQIPNIDSSASLVYLRESLNLLHQKHGHEVAIAAIALSPVDLPVMIMGMEAWIETVLFDRDGVRRVLDITLPFCVSFINALFKDGASCVIFPAPFLTTNIASRALTESLYSYYTDFFAQITGMVIVHHVAGKILANMDLLLQTPDNVKGVVLFQDEYEKFQKKIPEKIFFSGPEAISLLTRSDQQIRQTCSDLLKAKQNDSNFILTTTGPDIQPETPVDKIDILRQTVENEGR